MNYNALEGLCEVKPKETAPKVNNPEEAANILIPCFSKYNKPKTVEEFWVLSINANGALCGKPVMLTRGAVDGCDVPVSSLLREILSNSVSTQFIVAHNHPTGSLAASPQDIAITKRIAKAAQIVDLTFCDHLIISGKFYVSMRRENSECWLLTS